MTQEKPAKWRVWGFDLETLGLSPFKEESKILTLALTDGEQMISGVLDHPLGPAGELERQRLVVQAQTVLGDPGVMLVGHNVALFDVVWWEAITGHKVRARLFDTRVAQYLLDENAPNSLDDLAQAYLGKRKELNGLDRRHLSKADPAEVLRYNESDTRLSFELYEPMRAALFEDRAQARQFAFDMKEVAPALIRMSLRGVGLDVPLTNQRAQETEAELARLDKALNKSVGMEGVNWGSPKQVAKILYDDLRFDVLETTKSGAPSTDANTLRKLRLAMQGYKPGRELLDNILAYRGNSKFLGTYLRPLVEEHLGVDGRIHPTIHMGKGYGPHGKESGARTPRLSMSDPNMQQIPRDGLVKEVFIPAPGWLMGDSDYSQIELRIAAWLAKERSMLDAFEAGLDVHTLALARIEGRGYEEVQALIKSGNKKWVQKRAKIKTVNFLILYGGGAYQLQETMLKLGVYVSVQQAQALIAQFHENNPTLSKWITEQHVKILDTAQAVNVVGNVRRLPWARWSSRSHQQQAQRQGVNFMVQGLAARIMFWGLTRMERAVAPMGSHLVLTVHDDFVNEYPEGTDEAALEAAIRKSLLGDTLADMARYYGVPELETLPLEVDVKLGLKRWGG